MDRARVLEGVRIMRFEKLLDRHERGSLTQAETGEMLGMSERAHLDVGANPYQPEQNFPVAVLDHPSLPVARGHYEGG